MRNILYATMLCCGFIGELFCMDKVIENAQEKTKVVYLENTYLMELNSKIIATGKDEKLRPYVVLDQTVFYPQGGGQPCDHGTIEICDMKLSVVDVRSSKDGMIFHYVSDDELSNSIIGKEALCKVDEIRRILNARYHTAGHLVSNVVEELYPVLNAIKCHAFPKESYVEFKIISECNADAKVIDDKLKSAIESAIVTKIFHISAEEFEKSFYKLPYEIPGREEFRAMQIGNYSPVPCGGTHLKDTSEIGKILVGKISSKKGILRVTYSLP